MTELHAGTGTSSAADARTAGAEAARAALAALGDDAASGLGLVLVYTSVRYDVTALLDGVRSVTGDAPLAGSTSCGHATGATFVAPGSGVAVLALAGDRYRFGVGSAQGVAEQPEAAGEQAADAALAALGGADPLRPHHAVLLLVDGLTADAQRVLKGVHRVSGASVPTVGGAAADDGLMTSTTVMHDGAALSQGVVAVWLASPTPLTVVAEHGWTPVSDVELVTRADGRLVHEVGGRPAVQFYAEHAVMAAPGAVDLGPVDGTSPASYALGVIEPDGSHAVRGGFPLDDTTFTTFTALPEYSAVQVVTADADAVMGVVEPVVRTAAAGLTDAADGVEPRVLLAFDCVGRAGILGDRIAAEAAAVQDAAGSAVAFTLYGYGEIARTRGVGGVHNASLCALAL